MPPEDPNQDPQKGSEGERGQDEPITSQDPKGEPKSKSPKGDPEAKHQFVTPEALQGVLDAHKRTLSGEVKKQADQVKSLQEAIAALTDSISKKEEHIDDKDKKKPSSPDANELIELRRKVDELNRKLQEADSRAEEAEQSRRDETFRTTVINALTKSNCLDPEQAFLVIKPRLSVEDKSGKIFATVETNYGQEDLPLEDYIKREFSESVAPYMFKGKMKTGGPASGDDGMGQYQYTREQVFDPEEYLKDPEKYREAIQKGLVKGVPKPGMAKT